jgi:cellobiose-specific phosphotransferase system component IIC
MKNFTWKKWLVYTLSFFLILLLVSITWNYIDNGKSISKSFNTQEIIQALIVSILGGFFYTWVVHKKKE